MAKTVSLNLPGAKALYSKSSIDSNFNALNNNFSNFLHLSGVGEASNTMLGDLDMGGKKIRNIGASSEPFDVATKAYVDAASLTATSGTAVTSIIEDDDNDTGVNAETTADLDRLDLFAATSGGAANAIEIIGDDTVASSLSNPYTKALKHIVLDTDVRVQNDAGTTFMEMADTTSPNEILFTANSVDALRVQSTGIVPKVDIKLYDAAATALGATIGDEDGDTYIIFNKAVGGTDDDTFRVYAGGVEVITATASTLTLGGVASNLIAGGNLGSGSASVPVGATKALHIPEGTSGTTANDLIDNQVIIYASNASGIESTLDIDFKTGASSKSTVKLGDTSTFPNIVNVGGVLNSNDTTQSTSTSTGGLVVDGGLGVAKNQYIGGGLTVVGYASLAGVVTCYDTLSPVGGIDAGGVSLKQKVIAIGDWNMDTTPTISVAHGLTSSNIRGLDIGVRQDAPPGDTFWPLIGGHGGAYIDATNVVLSRNLGGTFDQTSWDDISYNRGWITITYVA